MRYVWVIRPNKLLVAWWAVDHWSGTQASVFDTMQEADCVAVSLALRYSSLIVSVEKVDRRMLTVEVVR